MASEQGEGVDPTEASHGPQECMPCRGSGRVISNLGGSANKVTCPWCQGQGVRHHDIDAQARWLSEEGADLPGADAEEAA